MRPNGLIINRKKNKNTLDGKFLKQSHSIAHARSSKLNAHKTIFHSTKEKFFIKVFCSQKALSRKAFKKNKYINLKYYIKPICLHETEEFFAHFLFITILILCTFPFSFSTTLPRTIPTEGGAQLILINLLSGFYLTKRKAYFWKANILSFSHFFCKCMHIFHFMRDQKSITSSSPLVERKLHVLAFQFIAILSFCILNSFNFFSGSSTCYVTRTEKIRRILVKAKAIRLKA